MLILEPGWATKAAIAPIGIEKLDQSISRTRTARPVDPFEW